MRTNLRPEDLGDLLEQPIVAVLATRRSDDTVMLSPVWFEWRDGGISVWAHGETDGKVRHIRRDPRVSVVVANSAWPYKALEIRGDAKITDDGFFEIVRRTGDRYLGTGTGDRMAAEMNLGVVIRIEPGSVRAWDYTDEA
jgi:PPOX class probable F420-dependent enzyme